MEHSKLPWKIDSRINYIHAANNHAALVEALQQCFNVLDEQLTGDEGASLKEAADAWNGAAKVLEKAKGN